MRHVANVAKKSGRRDDVPGSPLDRLDHDRRRSSGDFFFNHAPQILDRGFAAFIGRTIEAGGIGVGRDVIAGGQGTDQRFPIHIRNRKDAGCFPMKSAGESDNIGPLRERTREPNRGLDRLGAAAEKLSARKFAGRQLRD